MKRTYFLMLTLLIADSLLRQWLIPGYGLPAAPRATMSCPTALRLPSFFLITVAGARAMGCYSTQVLTDTIGVAQFQVLMHST